MRKYLTALLLLCFVTSFSQSKINTKFDENEKVNYGILTSDSYINSYFGLKINYPATWEIENNRSVKKLQKKGNELLKNHADLNKIEKELINRNSKNLLQLINQMLDLAKAEEGKLKLDLVQKDIITYSSSTL